MAELILPRKLHDRLYKNEGLASDVISNLNKILHVLEKGDLFFFPEYTDHSISHINGVLLSIEHIITDETLELLSPIEVGVLVTAVVLHDIGMFTNSDLFRNILKGKYDNIPGNWFKNEPSWKNLWQDYLKDSRYWNAEKRENVTGDPNYAVIATDKDIYEEKNKETITYKISHSLLQNGEDRRFIGEFIRRHHARLAYEIALNGYIGKTTCDFKREELPQYFMHLAGLVARSHGMNVRDTFDILKKTVGAKSWKTPSNIKVVLLMSLVRIADYLQIDPDRADPILLDIRTMYSKYSLREHEMHRSINCIQMDNDDPELIVVQATPEDAQMYVKIENLIKDLQQELDCSWAILGEVYGNRYQLRYRRIISNLSDENLIKGYQFVPKQFGFKFNSELSKLLIRPLYGDDPKIGVRELVQNAVDACRIRILENPNHKNKSTHVKVSLKTEKRLFTIEDYGIGMTLEEIENYFLTIGSSYDSTIEWKKTRDSYNGIYRTGRFGIGVLAAFLLGDRISVETKSTRSKQGYAFTASLQDSFIQINKINKKEYGTKISIVCSESCLQKLKPNQAANSLLSPFWTNWYVDSLPKVEYTIDDKPFSPSINIDFFNDFHYLELESKRKNFLYWKQLLYKYKDNYFLPLNRNPIDSQPRMLFINGFRITPLSHKKLFHLHGLEKYHKIIIPSLYLLDFDNEIPLNLDRSNIDEFTVFPFEKDLAIAMYKDMLCKLLAIDIVNFLQPECLFFNSCGFILNSQPYYPFTSIDFRDNNWCEPYVEGGLSGKYIIHLGGVEFSHVSFDNWRNLFDHCPEAFFSFHVNKQKYIYLEYIHKAPTQKLFKSFAYAVNDSDENEDYINKIIEDRENICIPGDIETSFVRSPFEHKMSQGYWVYHRLNENYNEQLINKVILFFNSNKLAKPAYILVHKVEGKAMQSDVDDFFNDYAEGNMVVPYDEDMRKVKFNKLYDECSEDIEKYKRLPSDEFISEFRDYYFPNNEI